VRAVELPEADRACRGTAAANSCSPAKGKRVSDSTAVVVNTRMPARTNGCRLQQGGLSDSRSCANHERPAVVLDPVEACERPPQLTLAADQERRQIGPLPRGAGSLSRHASSSHRRRKCPGRTRVARARKRRRAILRRAVAFLYNAGQHREIASPSLETQLRTSMISASPRSGRSRQPLFAGEVMTRCTTGSLRNAALSICRRWQRTGLSPSLS
jgi:hypothetical protein